MISSPSPAAKLSSKSETSDLLDQSALSTLAQRLVEAARRAGADAADAVAVRGVSQGVEVRDGRILRDHPVSYRRIATDDLANYEEEVAEPAGGGWGRPGDAERPIAGPRRLEPHSDRSAGH